MAYTIYVYESPDGSTFDCYQCAQPDCATHPFLTLEASSARFVCSVCAHVTPAMLVPVDETSSVWEPDEAPVEPVKDAA